jgi:hypothetical protein
MAFTGPDSMVARFISNNPRMIEVLLLALIVVAIMYFMGYIQISFSSGSLSNLRTGSNNPLGSFLGGAHAGLGGSIDRHQARWGGYTTDPRMASFNQSIRSVPRGLTPDVGSGSYSAAKKEEDAIAMLNGEIHKNVTGM